MDSEANKFLNNEFLTLSVSGALQHSGTYQKSVSEADKKRLRSFLRERLVRIADEYTSSVAEDRHLSNINGLADAVSSRFPGLLENGRFRIGVAQKALNLYLKYLWCLGKIPEPPHCPFDSSVLSSIPTYDGPTWTSMKKIDDYRKLVQAAKREAVKKQLSLSKWELKIWNKT